MRDYATLFDSAYLAKGLALYHSLDQHAHPFTLYILALDDETYWLLTSLKSLKHAKIIPLASVEMGMGLAEVRASRNWMEYCWTLASQLMQYVRLTNDIDMLTYLDSDLYFYSSPEPIFDELGTGSIAIIPHRFHKGNQRLAVNGIYNVGWLTIRFDETGRNCLRTWSAQCRDWCYHRNEDGKFGDQAYLDSWPAEYGEACKVIENIGAGLAPWNVMEYRLTKVADTLYVSHKDFKLSDETPVPRLIFYHFHEYTHDATGNPTRLTRHPHTLDHKRLIYAPYTNTIGAMCSAISMMRERRAQDQARLKEQGERA